MSHDTLKSDSNVARFSAADIYRNLEVAALQDIAKRFEEVDSLVDILEPCEKKTPPQALNDRAANELPEAEIILLPVALREIIAPESDPEQSGKAEQDCVAVPADDISPGTTTAAELVQVRPSVLDPSPALFQISALPAGQFRCQLGQLSVHRPVRDDAGKRAPSTLRLSMEERMRMSKRDYRKPLRKKKRTQPRRVVRLH